MNLFTIKSSTGSKIAVVPASEEKFSGRLLHFADAYQTEGDFGEMLFQKVGFKASDLWYSYYHMFWEKSFWGIVERPVVEAHITLKDRYVQSLGKNDDTLFEAGQYNLSAAPFMENKVLFPKDGEYVSFDIHPSLALLENLSQDFHELADFLNTLNKNPQHLTSLYHTPLFISPEMNYLVLKILDYLRSPASKRSYAEVLIQELLILLLMRGNITREPDWTLRQRDIDALHHARSLIIQEAEEYDSDDLYYTSIQLADKIDLSLYKFKTAFKRVFGISPYHLLVEARLYRARMLLKNTKYSILEIAMMTGYRSPEGFARAYKKFFKISPSEERRR